ALLWPVYRAFDGLYQAIASVYPHLLRWALTHRFVVVFASLILAAAVLFEARDLGVELIPEMSQGEFLVDLEWAAGTPLGQTTESVQMLDKRIRTVQGIDMVFALVGTSGQTGGSASDKKEHTAQLHLKLSGVEYEESVVSQVRSMLSDVPDLEYKFSRPSYFSFRTPIEVEISGYNIGTLKLLADEVMERLRGIEGLTDIRSSAEGGQPEIQIFFDRLRLAELGTTVQRIGELLRNKLQGEVATELARRDRKVDIRVRALDRERETLDDLKRMVVSPANYPVPVVLENVAAVRAVDGPAEIRRIDQERVAVISANIQGRDLGSVVADIESRLADMAMPEGFGLSMGGQNEEMVRSFDSMKFAISLAIFLVYLVMASQFESLLHPFVIMFTIPLGLVGSISALLITGETINVVVLIGLIMLAGIVVNNAIVLIDYVNQLRRESGMKKLEAVLRAGELRLRPILMTTSTTVL
ncbi:MAG: efflux RND transporter permease subunit, partial [Candidatus Latescibacterota bacterium]